jgi:hypothetical protein
MIGLTPTWILLIAPGEDVDTPGVAEERQDDAPISTQLRACPFVTWGTEGPVKVRLLRALLQRWAGLIRPVAIYDPAGALRPRRTTSQACWPLS